MAEKPSSPPATGAATGQGGAETSAAGASPAKDPTAICATASIFSRTMCVYRECQKPEFYNLAVCVADRKHWEEQNKSRN
jgi:non-specific serine/threonine protein kinase